MTAEVSSIAERLAMETNFRGLTGGQLRDLRDAGRVVSECRRQLEKTGHNIVGEVLRADAPFREWDHYPDGDAVDPETHAQYYYHAHPPEGRGANEHGHFHLFLRRAGMPSGVRPLDGQALPDDDRKALCHLVAISMDPYGLPIRLFTTNRWVTGDTWYRASDVIRMLDGFAVDIVRPNLVVSRWITAMVKLFRPQIASLLTVRDRAIDAWRTSHPDIDTFEDRRLEITSSVEVNVDAQILSVSEHIQGRHARSPAA